MDSARSEEKKGASNPNRINRLLLEKAKHDFAVLNSLVMVSNKGLTNQDTFELRKGLREKGIGIQVVRNRISIRAFREMGVEQAEKLFEGQTAVIEAEDPVTAAKVAVEFAKKFDKKLIVLGGLVEGKVLNGSEIIQLAKSKSKPELLADLARILLVPGARLAGSLLGPGGRLAGAVKAIVEKQEKQAEGQAGGGEAKGDAA